MAVASTAATGRPLWVKVCGIRTEADAESAAEAGADLIGLIFVEKSRRYVALERAQAIVKALDKHAGLEPGSAVSSEVAHVQDAVSLPSTSDPTAVASARLLAGLEQLRRLKALRRRPLVVGVFADHTAELIEGLVAAVPLDVVQLHGVREPAELPASLSVPVIRALHVAPSDTAQTVLDRAVMHADWASVVLLDTAASAASQHQGGTGRTFDHSLAVQLAPRLPFLLAGGLNPANVGGVVQSVQPAGVDVSGGVEDDSTGDKVPALIHAFVYAARRG